MNSDVDKLAKIASVAELVQEVAKELVHRDSSRADSALELAGRLWNSISTDDVTKASSENDHALEALADLEDLVRLRIELERSVGHAVARAAVDSLSRAVSAVFDGAGR